jgi:hypothetical protein
MATQPSSSASHAKIKCPILFFGTFMTSSKTGRRRSCSTCSHQVPSTTDSTGMPFLGGTYRPSLQSLYSKCVLCFWTKVLDQIDPGLAYHINLYTVEQAQKFPPIMIDGWWIIVLRRFFESFDNFERWLGFPAPPQQEEDASTNKTRWLQTSIFPFVVSLAKEDDIEMMDTGGTTISNLKAPR